MKNTSFLIPTKPSDAYFIYHFNLKRTISRCVSFSTSSIIILLHNMLRKRPALYLQKKSMHMKIKMYMILLFITKHPNCSSLEGKKSYTNKFSNLTDQIADENSLAL